MLNTNTQSYFNIIDAGVGKGLKIASHDMAFSDRSEEIKFR